MEPVLDGQEKMNKCAHRSAPKEVFIGCPCKNQKRTVYECIARSIPEVTAPICALCPLFQPKSS